MDGLLREYLPPDYLPGAAPAMQRTLKSSISCVGVGLHTGAKLSLTLCPAEPESGITFHRTDCDAFIPARYNHVVDTRLCTVIASAERPDIRVGTIEHLMAALAGAGVGNAIVQVDGPEIPILDGSAANFAFLIECAGVAEQAAPAPVIEILRPVRVSHAGASAELRPAVSTAEGYGLDMDFSIAFDATAIGQQSLRFRLTPTSFRELARARTFTLASEVAQLRAAGLARGGSLDNAVVVDGDVVLNPGGLRMRDEFVRHKMLDAVGDLALAGALLHGQFVGDRSGHALNNRLLRAVFADPANWRRVPVAMRQPTPLEWSPRELQVA